MIKLKQFNVSIHNQPILRDINLSIKSGECVVLCGESGCGKSTLIRALSGLSPELYPGEVSGDGKVMNQPMPTDDFNKFVSDIGVVFQNPKTQFFTNDVYSELAFSMENYGVSRPDMIKKVAQISSEFDLTDKLSDSMFSLSGGEKQRVAFASVCMMPQRLFLLDEPSSNLDSHTIHQLKASIQWLKKQGATIVIAEHRLFYLSELADRYVWMQDGSIADEFDALTMSKKTDETLEKMALRSLKEPSIDRKKSAVTHDPILVCEQINYSYKKRSATISIPSLELSNKSVIGLTGNNGSGKTTLSHVLTGLIPVKKGHIYFRGEECTSKDLIKKSFLVMQDVNLQLFFETVEKELTVQAKKLELYEQVVEKLHLTHLLRRHPQSLSGGEKQRVAIATAVLSGKEIIVFDEPTSGLDLKHMEDVSETITWLNKLESVLVIVITHDKEFLIRTCQRVIEMKDGHVVSDSDIMPTMINLD